MDCKERVAKIRRGLRKEREERKSGVKMSGKIFFWPLPLIGKRYRFFRRLSRFILLIHKRIEIIGHSGTCL
jgi:hypothetical protein